MKASNSNIVGKEINRSGTELLVSSIPWHLSKWLQNYGRWVIDDWAVLIGSALDNGMRKPSLAYSYQLLSLLIDVVLVLGHTIAASKDSPNIAITGSSWTSSSVVLWKSVILLSKRPPFVLSYYHLRSAERIILSVFCIFLNIHYYFFLRLLLLFSAGRSLFVSVTRDASVCKYHEWLESYIWPKWLFKTCSLWRQTEGIMTLLEIFSLCVIIGLLLPLLPTPKPRACWSSNFVKRCINYLLHKIQHLTTTKNPTDNSFRRSCESTCY